KVQAIDKYANSSVRSDFGMAIGLIPNIGCSSCADGPDNFINEEGIPIEFNLYNNYPNPFNPSTSIRFDIPSDNFVDIKVYNVLGMEVVTLVNEFRKAGSYVVSFNGANLSSGIYYYKIKSGSQSGAGEFEKVRKMMLIK
ncbi:MAG: T9SS type A sorting domain-containing protein, partial [Ignavibacteria bacterium]|nr:T9SS type A sorting domain-containing protein [Ignavibacteria bacterium]